MAHLQEVERRTNELASPAQPAARRTRLALGFAVAGAFSFWLPDVFIHVHAGPTLDVRHGWAITVLAPATFLLTYLIATRYARNFKWAAAAMLAGVWFSGGLFMTIAATFSGSEYIGGTGIWRAVAILLSVIPIVTYVLAAYDGSLFALLAVSVGALLFWGLRASWVLWSAGAAPDTLPKKPAARNKSKAA